MHDTLCCVFYSLVVIMFGEDGYIKRKNYIKDPKFLSEAVSNYVNVYLLEDRLLLADEKEKLLNWPEVFISFSIHDLIKIAETDLREIFFKKATDEQKNEVLLLEACRKGWKSSAEEFLKKGVKFYYEEYLHIISKVGILELILRYRCNEITQTEFDSVLSYRINKDIRGFKIIAMLLKYGADLKDTHISFLNQKEFILMMSIVSEEDNAALSIKMLCRYGDYIKRVIEAQGNSIDEGKAKSKIKDRAYDVWLEITKASPEAFGALIYGGATKDIYNAESAEDNKLRAYQIANNTGAKGVDRIISVMSFWICSQVVGNVPARKIAEQFAQSLVPSKAVLKMMPGCKYVDRDAFVRVNELVKFLGNLRLLYGYDKNYHMLPAELYMDISSCASQISREHMPLVLKEYVAGCIMKKSDRALVVDMVDKIFAEVEGSDNVYGRIR